MNTTIPVAAVSDSYRSGGNWPEQNDVCIFNGDRLPPEI